MVTILRYVPREYRSGNSKTRESSSYRPVVDREARSEIPKNAMYAIPKVVRADRKTMEEARSARCPKEQIQRGHADVAERRAG